jgi:type I restriction enzyme S subunit
MNKNSNPKETPHVDGLDLDRSDWELVSFGDVAIKQNESVDRSNTSVTRYVAGEHMGSEDLHLRTWGEIGEDYLGPAFIRKFEKGDILYGSRRTYLRKVVIAPFDGITANTTFVIKANEKIILKDLLPFVMLSEGFSQHSIRNSKGSVNPYVNWKDIASYEFLLPPKDKQVKLAELLWAGDQNSEQLIKIIERLEVFRDSTYKEFTKSTGQKDTRKIVDILLDGPRNGYSPKTSDNGSSFTVSIGAIKNGLFSTEGHLKQASVSANILENFSVRKGDVFVVRGNGNRFLCGRAGIAMKDYENLFYPDLLIRLRFDSNLVIPEFALYQWNHPCTHQRLLRRAKSTNGIWKINGGDIKKHTLVVPCTLIQQKILDQLRLIENQYKKSIDTLTNSNRLQKSIINQIF